MFFLIFHLNLCIFIPIKDLKEKIKEEEARKGVAGISGIGINLPKFQQAQLGLTANELSPKGSCKILFTAGYLVSVEESCDYKAYKNSKI